MAFPDRPTFESGAADAVWWRTRVGSQTYVCSTMAWTFVAQLQDRLRERVPDATPGFDGQTTGGAAIVSDGAWGPATQRALYEALKRADAPHALLNVVRAEAGGVRGHVGLGSYGAAIWLFHRGPFGAVPGAAAARDITVPGDTVLPRWSVAPPLEAIPDAGVFCREQGVDTPPGPPLPPQPPPAVVPEETPPGEPPQPPRPDAVQGTGVHIDLPPGVPLPSGRRATPPVSTAFLVAAGVVGVGGLTALALLTRPRRSGTAPPRSNPRRARRRARRR
jgi:hypothetical protein